jgi:CHAT domain-containing protein
MSDKSFQSEDKDSRELLPEQWEKIFALLDNLFGLDDPVTLVETVNQLLALGTLEILREYLEEMQNSDNDLLIAATNVTLSLLHDAQTHGTRAAVIRYIDERRRTVAALEALEDADGADEFYRVLEEKQQLLLSDLALTFLTLAYMDISDAEDNAAGAGQLKQHIALIKEARVRGVPVAWERYLADEQQILDAFALLDGKPHDVFYQLLQEKRDILITERAIWLKQFQVAQARLEGDPLADQYEMYVFFLQDAYTRGLEDAWKDFAGVDQAIVELQNLEEPEEILKFLQKHEDVLRSDAALPVMRSYIARAKADGAQDMVRYFERWYQVLKDAHHSGITAAWGKFYHHMLFEAYGQLASSAESRISDCTARLSHLPVGTLSWADTRTERGGIYFSQVVREQMDKATLDLAIADFQAALPVYKKHGKLDQYAEALDNLGTALIFALFLQQTGEAFLKRTIADLTVSLIGTYDDFAPSAHTPVHNLPRYRQQILDLFTEALTLYQQQGRQDDWARTLLKRAGIYRIGDQVSIQDMLLAIDDYTAALNVLKKETSPYEWMGATGNRGGCYMQIGASGREGYYEKAIADLQAELTVATRQASPALYRKTQLFLYQAFERSGRWEEAYGAIKEAIAAQHDLLAMNPVESDQLSLISDVANTQVEIYVRAAQVLSRFKRPALQEAACMLELGRAQLLRLTLSLDTLDPNRIADPASRRRIEKFLAALKTWKRHQQQVAGAISSANTRPLPTSASAQKQEALLQQTETDHTAFLETIEAIRRYDDPDFMTPIPAFDDIQRALPAPESALVYLAAGAESGLALLIIRDRKGQVQTQYIPLPQLKNRAVSDLVEMNSRKAVPIKLQQVISRLGQMGLNDVVQVLSWSGVQKVRIIPFGLLGLFPLPAVVVQNGQGQRKRLGDLFEVTLAPSARAVEVAEQRAAKLNRATHPDILLGGGVAGLAYTRAEIEAIQRIAIRCGQDERHIRYLRSQAISKNRVVRALKQCWYAHLAVHGVYQPDQPRRSHLLLTDKEDTREEHCIFLGEALERRTSDGGLEFDLEGVRLLVLSACETAVIDIRQAPDEVMGLASGFLQAGAAGVIASLWAVDDRATCLLMSRFAQLYLDPRRGLSPARALAEAQRWLREEATNAVLMTYDPAETGQPAVQKGAAPQTGEYAAASRLRSLRLGYESGLAEIHTEAAMRAAENPHALPYADPFYWAAFVVTGC